MATWRKVCSCKGATFSGPRIISRQELQSDGNIVHVQSFVRWACDACDAPWKELSDEELAKEQSTG